MNAIICTFRGVGSVRFEEGLRHFLGFIAVVITRKDFYSALNVQKHSWLALFFYKDADTHTHTLFKKVTFMLDFHNS